MTTKTKGATTNANKMFKLKDYVKKDRLVWHKLSANPRAIRLLESNVDRVDWDALSENPEAICLLEENFDRINWNRRILR